MVSIAISQRKQWKNNTVQYMLRVWNSTYSRTESKKYLHFLTRCIDPFTRQHDMGSASAARNVNLRCPWQFQLPSSWHGGFLFSWGHGAVPFNHLLTLLRATRFFHGRCQGWRWCGSIIYRTICVKARVAETQSNLKSRACMRPDQCEAIPIAFSILNYTL